MNFDEITARIEQQLHRYFQAKEENIETDPVTLSRGLVLERLGPAKDKWGRDVHLVLVKVLKKNAHHKKDDEVIWEIPTEQELEKVRSHGVHTQDDLLRLWVDSPGNDSDLSRW